MNNIGNRLWDIFFYLFVTTVLGWTAYAAFAIGVPSIWEDFNMNDTNILYYIIGWLYIIGLCIIGVGFVVLFLLCLFLTGYEIFYKGFEEK